MKPFPPNNSPHLISDKHIRHVCPSVISVKKDRSGGGGRRIRDPTLVGRTAWTTLTSPAQTGIPLAPPQQIGDLGLSWKQGRISRAVDIRPPLTPARGGQRGRACQMGSGRGLSHWCVLGPIPARATPWGGVGWKHKG